MGLACHLEKIPVFECDNIHNIFKQNQIVEQVHEGQHSLVEMLLVLCEVLTI